MLIAGPAAGDQACGEVGMGRMLEAAQLATEVERFFQPKLLAGKRVLVTAGPTEEPIDPVRVLTNSSSGKMGYAVARAAREAGAAVTLVSGPVGACHARGRLARQRAHRPGNVRRGEERRDRRATCSSRSPRSPTIA